MDEDLRIVAAPRDGHDDAIGNLAAFLIEGRRVEVAPGALHGRSPLEAGVRWLSSPGEVPAGTTYWIAWVTVGRNAEGERGYKGLTISSMVIDRQAMVGYKHLAQHVNAIRAALAGEADLDGLPPESRDALREELIRRGEPLWNHASAEIRRLLA